MFTGLVEATVPLRAVRRQSADHVRLVVHNPWPEDVPKLGASVAIDGVCLTVVAPEPAAGADEAGSLAFVVGPETLARTTLGQLTVGARVHLERALALGDRLGGHLVSGHVDGVGTVRARRSQDDSLYLAVAVPADVLRLSAAQGAITLAGVSLTITHLEDSLVWVCLIPHTLAVTHLGALQPGDALNCEADMLARYVARLLPRAVSTDPTGGCRVL